MNGNEYRCVCAFVYMCMNENAGVFACVHVCACE